MTILSKGGFYIFGLILISINLSLAKSLSPSEWLSKHQKESDTATLLHEVTLIDWSINREENEVWIELSNAISSCAFLGSKDALTSSRNFKKEMSILIQILKEIPCENFNNLIISDSLRRIIIGRCFDYLIKYPEDWVIVSEISKEIRKLDIQSVRRILNSISKLNLRETDSIDALSNSLLEELKVSIKDILLNRIFDNPKILCNSLLLKNRDIQLLTYRICETDYVLDGLLEGVLQFLEAGGELNSLITNEIHNVNPIVEKQTNKYRSEFFKISIITSTHLQNALKQFSSAPLEKQFFRQVALE